MTDDIYLRINEVKGIVKVGTTTIYRMMKTGEFPQAIKIGTTTLWSKNGLLSWLESKNKAVNPTKKQG
jgi:predicted DNA-binding transcriptional regulator AlpA